MIESSLGLGQSIKPSKTKQFAAMQLKPSMLGLIVKTGRFFYVHSATNWRNRVQPAKQTVGPDWQWVTRLFDSVAVKVTTNRPREKSSYPSWVKVDATLKQVKHGKQRL